MTCQQMPRDSARHTQTTPVSVLRCLAVSVFVCWRLLACCVTWRCHGDVWGMSGGCLRDIWVVFIEIGGSRMRLGGMWVLSPYSMEQKCYLGRALKGITFVTWPYWDIEISKWPHISFPKMVGLWHFLWFLVSPEKNYSSQLLLITLYFRTIWKCIMDSWNKLNCKTLNANTH